jgi:peptidoglycan-N-acetylglucosamine deacetylase
MLKNIIKKSIPRFLLTSRLRQSDLPYILLTFDDGPDPETTPSVLERLRLYNVRSVFFIPGCRIHKAPHLLSKILEDGHIIGNHSYIHSNNKQPGFLEYVKDLKKCQKEIEQHTGISPDVFRPPGGRLSIESLLIPQLLNMRTVTWSLDVEDWKCRVPEKANECAREILRSITPGDIVLLHDDNHLILHILDMILPVLIDRKYDLSGGIDLL